MKNRLKEFREKEGLTQEQLGELIGVSRQAINAIETEKYEPSIWIAYDIAKVFNCSIEEVFLFEESERKSRSQQSKGGI
ncbi:putative transcriptional regulator [Clostridium cavendishii DSM 21758]|uniref:Putative transcriptional regulator n=1 Tax=Clostridium cavendishii DSM 21758 TaxID=1121302 RepID=A0A1M6GC91_9CLOT|nr:helix-turn-helix transcriptional regulator [Clostridium cavendishii]SHJ07547.1 putative transcriptional regulator [Clostridium cavendishii DSM 21758]